MPRFIYPSKDVVFQNAVLSAGFAMLRGNLCNIYRLKIETFSPGEVLLPHRHELCNRNVVQVYPFHKKNRLLMQYIARKVYPVRKWSSNQLHAFFVCASLLPPPLEKESLLKHFSQFIPPVSQKMHKLPIDLTCWKSKKSCIASIHVLL